LGIPEYSEFFDAVLLTSTCSVLSHLFPQHILTEHLLSAGWERTHPPSFSFITGNTELRPPEDFQENTLFRPINTKKLDCFFEQTLLSLAFPLTTTCLPAHMGSTQDQSQGLLLPEAHADPFISTWLCPPHKSIW
jgi:hypothetical protein